MHVKRSTLVFLFFLVSSFCIFPLGVFERPVALAGTVIPHPSAAPDFSLSDQRGVQFHMADTKGKVVVMSFIYTHCTDLCPFISVKLKSAMNLLGKDADKAVFVAVTTDPDRDTEKVIGAYSRAAGLFDSWHFLTGTKAAVKDVWFNYGVGVDIEKPADAAAADTGNAVDAPEPTQGLSTAEADLARNIAAQFGGGYNVSHTAPFWFIDRQGKIRAFLDADALPSEIAANVRALMNR